MCRELIPLWTEGIIHKGTKYRVAIVNAIFDGKGYEKVTHTQGGASLEGCNACDFGGYSFASTVTYPLYSRYTELNDPRRQKRPAPNMYNIHVENQPAPTNRSYEDYVTDATLVELEGLKHSNGVKGMWALHVLPYAAHIVKTKDVAHCCYHIVEVICLLYHCCLFTMFLLCGCFKFALCLLQICYVFAV